MEPDFWIDSNKASKLLRENSALEKEIKSWEDLENIKEDTKIIIEFADSQEISLSEAEHELIKYRNKINEIEVKLTLSNNYDKQSAIMTIHPGAGGTESQDWAEMLYRMYDRWIEKKNFKKSILDFQPGDEAGIKDITIEIEGEFAYGFLKSEAGVHRLVRISPFDSNNKRHTSFASVFVYPASDEDIEIEIDPNDLRIDTYRASGAGGQHVNKTDSAIRITHLPSNVVVQCQNERSQHKNKATAMKVLKAKLYQIELEKEKEQMKNLEDEKKDIAWGNQIRSYVFHPYNMVKDHRTKEETSNISKVMNGEIDKFINSFLINNLKN